jgi:hypothetical protein
LDFTVMHIMLYQDSDSLKQLGLRWTWQQWDTTHACCVMGRFHLYQMNSEN